MRNTLLTKFKNNAFLIILIISAVLFWTVPFVLLRKGTDPSVISIIEWIEFPIIGLVISYYLIVKNDFYKFLSIGLFVCFIFSRFYVQANLFAVGTMGVIILISLIINIIKYKVHFRKGKLFYGLLIYGITIALGGLFVKSEYFLLQNLVGILYGGLIVFVYTFCISKTNETPYKESAKLFTGLGLCIVLEEIIYFISSGDLSSLLNAGVVIGWGWHTNLGMVYLITSPFAVYLAMKSESLKEKILYYTIFGLQVVGCIMSHARSAMVFMALGCIILYIYGLVHNRKDKKKIRALIIFLVALIVTLGLIVLLVYVFNNDIFDKIYAFIQDRMNCDSIKSRIEVYKYFLSYYPEHPIFGYGILYPFKIQLEAPTVATGGYQWGHDTFIHALFITGTVGALGVTFMMWEKYYSVLKRNNLEKFILFISFLIPELFGLIDVTYFVLQYMVPMLISLVLFNPYIESLPYLKEKEAITNNN